MGIWSLVYATEPNQPNAKPTIKVIAGTLKALRDASVNAADVKVLYRPRTGQWRAITCHDVLIKGSGNKTQILASASAVLALNSPVGSGLGAEGFVFDSAGFVAATRYDPVRGRNAIGAFVAAPLRWYVRDYEVPFWSNIQDDLPPFPKKP